MSYKAFASQHLATAPASMQDNVSDNSKPVEGDNNLSAPDAMLTEAHNQQPSVATHVSKSFKRRFFSRAYEI